MCISDIRYQPENKGITGRKDGRRQPCVLLLHYAGTVADLSAPFKEERIAKVTESANQWTRSKKEPESWIARRFLEKTAGDLVAHTNCYRKFVHARNIQKALSVKKRQVRLINYYLTGIILFYLVH